MGWGERVIAVAGDAVTRLLGYSFVGSEFVFGPLGSKVSKYGFFFAFQVLPIIIFIAAFFAILYHYGVMQFIIRQMAKVMMRFMGASGVESMDVAASIFMGQTEAPLTDQSLPCDGDAVGADGHHDGGHGAHFRRRDGRLYRLWHRSAASAGCGDHDRARDDSDCQDAGARD